MGQIYSPGKPPGSAPDCTQPLIPFLLSLAGVHLVRLVGVFPGGVGAAAPEPHPPPVQGALRAPHPPRLRHDQHPPGAHPLLTHLDPIRRLALPR